MNVGSNLAGTILSSEKHFSDYLTQTKSQTQTEQELTLKEFEEAYTTLQRNKASAVDDINSNVIKLTYNALRGIPIITSRRGGGGGYTDLVTVSDGKI